MARRRNASSPECGYTVDRLDGEVITCRKRGAHYCEPRADRVIAFFSEVLLHTKGSWARRVFVPAKWQEHDILRPLFGTVRWDTFHKQYVRTYRIAWIELGRKNGKSELAAGIALYLLVADDEESAEVYGAAKDTAQAGKVFEVAQRMSQLSPLLRERLTFRQHSRRLIDESKGSYYQVITADAAGELGHNPHGIVIDEVLTQADGRLWNALRTAMGARAQPLMVALTTATDDPASFCAQQHEEFARVAEDPGRAPHIFVYMRNTPKDADPWVEKNWDFANPALGEFLDVQALRDEALEARNDPTKENSFRQFRLNQHVQQTTRWMPLHLWDACGGLVREDELRGRMCFGGLDLASTTDLAAWVLLFPDESGTTCDVLWRFWTPEDQIPLLDRHTGGRASVWAREKLLTTTEGNWIDFEQVRKQIQKDTQSFVMAGIGLDRKFAEDTWQWMVLNDWPADQVSQGYGLNGGLQETMRLVKAQRLNHGGNPVARWNADSAEVKQDDQEKIKLVKPDRNASGKRVDGMAALAMAVTRYLEWVDNQRSIYEDREPVVL